jgi:hypothetical protein
MLTLTLGHNNKYYEKLETEDKIDPLDLEIRKLNDEMTMYVH